MDNLSPTKAFIKVDFPTFGFPMMFTKPALCVIILFFIIIKSHSFQNGFFCCLFVKNFNPNSRFSATNVQSKLMVSIKIYTSLPHFKLINGGLGINFSRIQNCIWKTCLVWRIGKMLHFKAKSRTRRIGF